MPFFTLNTGNCRVHKYDPGDAPYNDNMGPQRTQIQKDAVNGGRGCRTFPTRRNHHDLEWQHSWKAAGLKVIVDFDYCPTFCRRCFPDTVRDMNKSFTRIWEWVNRDY